MTDCDQSTAPPSDRDIRIALIVTLAGLIASAACALASPEGLHHFDDLTHYLYARWAWEWPAYLIDHWGRPGFTVPYFPFAALGWTACRLFSAVLSAGAGWFAFRIAQHAGLRHAWAATLLTWAQPLFFLLSQTTLTETPLAFYLSGAILLALRGSWSLSSLLMSAAFVTRHEAILFLPIWLVFAWAQGASLWRLWPMISAPLIVNLAAWQAGQTSTIELYLRPRPSSQYGSDGWLTFFARALHAWGPGVTALALSGIALQCPHVWRDYIRPAMARRPRESTMSQAAFPVSASKQAAAIGLTAICVIAYFSAQTVIRVFGLFDSGGYARFLIPISPLIGVCALMGWNALTSQVSPIRANARAALIAAILLLWVSLEWQVRRHAGIDIEFPALRQAIIAIRVATAMMFLLSLVSHWYERRHVNEHRTAALTRGARLIPGAIAAMIVLTIGVFHRPLQPPAQAAIIADAMAALRQQNLEDRPIVSAVTWIDYVTGQRHPPHRPPTRRRLALAPIGSLFAWEAQFAGSHDHQISLVELEQNPAFRPVLVTRPRPFHTDPYLHIFEKIGPWDDARPENAP